MVNEKGNLILDNKGKPVIENPVLNQKQGLLERASDFYSNYLLSQYTLKGTWSFLFESFKSD